MERRSPSEHLRASEYVGAAPVYHQDLRLSAVAVLTDHWDERVHAASQLTSLPQPCALSVRERRFPWLQNRLFDLRYLANLLTNKASRALLREERNEPIKPFAV